MLGRRRIGGFEANFLDREAYCHEEFDKIAVLALRALEMVCFEFYFGE